MKRGDKYKHYKCGEYEFMGIALPIEDEIIDSTHLVEFAKARYHENTNDMELFTSSDGAMFINSDVPHVIYQAENDYGSEKVWAREVDNFFDTVTTMDNGLVKRFTLKI